MRTPDPLREPVCAPAFRRSDAFPRGTFRSAILPLQLAALVSSCVAAIILFGCSKDPALQAIETDANGYLCQKCGAKVYSERKTFLEKCPACGQDALADVVGYVCPHDQHLTLRPKVSGPAGAAVCEQCQTHLKNAMISPREKDLKAWGAEKTLAKK